jgi:hypothetical protein
VNARTTPPGRVGRCTVSEARAIITESTEVKSPQARPAAAAHLQPPATVTVHSLAVTVPSLA